LTKRLKLAWVVDPVPKLRRCGRKGQNATAAGDRPFEPQVHIEFFN